MKKKYKHDIDVLLDILSLHDKEIKELKPGHRIKVKCLKCGGSLRISRTECNGHIWFVCENKDFIVIQ